MNEEILSLAIDLVKRLSPAKISTLIGQIPTVIQHDTQDQFSDLLVTQNSRSTFSQLLQLANQHAMPGEVLAGILSGASATHQQLADEESIEFVWTGPTTSFVATRRTEQVLLQLIDSAQKELFIVSFVAYDVKSITEKLKASIQRGVKVRILLEESQEFGGSISHDGAAIIRRNIPGVSLYAWKNEAIEFKGGRVHAKMAIADDGVAFLTSANLTDYAMEKNIEAGILLNGGYQPHQIRCHLDALIDMKILVPA